MNSRNEIFVKSNENFAVHMIKFLAQILLVIKKKNIANNEIKEAKTLKWKKICLFGMLLIGKLAWQEISIYFGQLRYTSNSEQFKFHGIIITFTKFGCKMAIHSMWFCLTYYFRKGFIKECMPLENM